MPYADKTLPAHAAAELARGARRVALGGWSLSRRPIGMVWEWVARDIRFRELVVATGSLEADILAAVDGVRSIRSFFLGIEAVGPGPGLKSELDVIEETESSLTLGLQAAAQGLPFLPLPLAHAEALRAVRPDLSPTVDPYAEGDASQCLAIPALPIDIAYVHALRADRRGNAFLSGHKAADRLLAHAARCVVVSCEELVDDLAACGDTADLVEPLVDHVVLLPGGARPGNCLPLYETDWPVLLDYVATDRDAVADWVLQAIPPPA